VDQTSNSYLVYSSRQEASREKEKARKKRKEKRRAKKVKIVPLTTEKQDGTINQNL
jgi:hypothetical protein